MSNLDAYGANFSHVRSLAPFHCEVMEINYNS